MAGTYIVVTKVRQIVTPEVDSPEEAVKAAEAAIVLSTDSEIGDDSQGYNQSRMKSSVFSGQPWSNSSGELGKQQLGNGAN